MKQQESHLFVAAAFLDQLIVIKDQYDWCPKYRQFVDEERYHRPRDVRDRDPGSPEHLVAIQAGAGSQERVHDVPPQPAGVIVIRVEGDPGERPVFRRAGLPLCRENGLAGARRSLNEDELGGGAGQRVNELPPLYPLLTQAGSVKLVLHRQACKRAGFWNRNRTQGALALQASFAHVHDHSRS